MLRKLALIVAMLAGIAAGPHASHALELGLTPTNVSTMWTNVNNGLLATAGIVDSDPAFRERLAAMKPKPVSGKKPTDVLEQVGRFRDAFDRLRRASKLDPAKRHGDAKGAVTPSDVFLNSGYVLDSVVDWIIRNSSPELLVSQFYADHGLSGKTPNDAFALVDLANRRIERILARIKT